MRRSLLLLAMCVSLVAAGQAHAQAIRDVTANARAVTRVNAKLRFTTMIVLPDTEEILDIVCGDKDFWVISGAQNLAYVKPAKAGVTTNLNLITAAGHIYAFLLAEGAPEADLAVYVTAEELTAPVAAPKKLFSAAHVEALERQIQDAQHEVLAAREAASQSMEATRVAAERADADAQAERDAFRAGYPATLQFPYWFEAHAKPFLVSAIFHDGRFTYIRTEGTELPTLYEVRDRVPNLVNFEVQDGLFIVPKVLDEGYLVLGKKRLAFGRVGQGRAR